MDILSYRMWHTNMTKGNLAWEIPLKRGKKRKSEGKKGEKNREDRKWIQRTAESHSCSFGRVVWHMSTCLNMRNYHSCIKVSNGLMQLYNHT